MYKVGQQVFVVQDFDADFDSPWSGRIVMHVIAEEKADSDGYVIVEGPGPSAKNRFFHPGRVFTSRSGAAFRLGELRDKEVERLQAEIDRLKSLNF